jgi:hypothetical protein
VIAVLAIVGRLYLWPLEMLVPILFILLLIGILMAVSYDRERRLEHSLLKLKELGAYFVRRFAGNSSLSMHILSVVLLAIHLCLSLPSSMVCSMSITPDCGNGYEAAV